MAASDPKWINADGGSPAYAAVELRRLDGAAWWKGGEADRLGARAGVLPGGSAVLSLSGTTVTVRDLQAVVYPGLTATSGPYTVAHLEETHELDPADVTNARVDIVVLRVYDDDEDSSGDREAVTELITGTPAGSPTAPSTPAGAVRLGFIDVPASGGGDPTLTVDAPWTVAAGGILPVRTDAELTGASSGLHDGAMRWRQDAGVLEVHNGSSTWTEIARRTVPRARLRRTAGQAITNNTDTTVDWNAEDWDTAAGHDNGTNPSRYTATVAGFYRVEARVQWEFDTTGRRMAWLWLNGSSVVGSRQIDEPGTNETWCTPTAATVQLSVGDYVEVRVAQTSGGDLDVQGGTTQASSTLTVDYLGPL
ncbi:hypothetical protein ACFHW1_04910 [Micromonospora sp. LOL_014]|uniref:hypothetical protein n=1 Tax=Micromonospora sp. LOL_014 TaxID=3345415 RepID=UPI003A8531EE